jgi:hypothetical protein
MAALLCALVLLIIAHAFLDNVPGEYLIRAALTTAVYVFALIAVAARRRTLAIAGTIIVPAIVAKWLDHLHPDLLPHGTYLAMGLLAMGFIFVELLRYVLRAGQVDSEILFAGIAGYLMLVFLWASAYLFVSRLDSSAIAFNGGHAAQRLDEFTAIYFSFGVLGTVGFGDVVPVTRAARLLAVMEATVGLFYVTILIARLVSLYVPRGPDIPPARET